MTDEVLMHKLTRPSDEQIIAELSREFGLQEDLESLFRKAYDWYFVPRSKASQAYAERVVHNIVRQRKEANMPAPAWLGRVYEILCDQNIGIQRSVPPPPDPGTGPSP